MNLTIRLALVCSFAAAGCSNDFSDGSEPIKANETGSTTQELLRYTPYTLWLPNGISNTAPIPVSICWQTPGWGFEKGAVIHALRGTWGRVSPFDFSESCTGNYVNVYIYNGGCCGTTNPGGFGSTVYLNLEPVGPGPAPAPSYPIDKVRYQAVHEFGHLLGFAHEQDSASRTNTSCSIEPDGRVQTPWSNTYQVGGGYDPKSIMHYCNPWNNGLGYLSTTDVLGIRFVYGTKPMKLRGDFSGSVGADLGVWHPSNGQWELTGLSPIVWGESGDVVVPGNFDGTGKDNRAVWRPSTGTWYVDDGITLPVVLGNSGDVPVPADYDGDGKTDMAVWTSAGMWKVRTVNGAGTPVVTNTTWGVAGDIPVPGDYNGDGTSDIAIYRPSEGKWYVNLNNGYYNVALGTSGSIPVPGDYVGEGKVRPAVYNPSSGQWWFLHRPSLDDNLAYKVGNTWRLNWGGMAGDIPIPASYGGMGITEIGIWRPGSPGVFHRIGYPAQNFGQTGDVPMSRYAN